MEKSNKEFALGDGVSWTGWTDTNPGTVVKVTPNRVTVRRDDLVLSDEAKEKLRAAGGMAAGEHHFIDGMPGVTFEPAQYETVFTKRKDGFFREVGSKTTLHHGRCFYRDPCF